ncbi:AraC family transcriptional regulator [Paenibacillus flagellatus]|uniref:HTH araC/xylS-type domain-containing protein n=1 Tax=Paenibacillus flagellatus TaxID=2211139 RepID=A0A2V5KGS1_9BACL|nr:AraC family transcriptional regulator [Paenibacillus flagellatus]PYI53420.1 hypothetical protein DLM86_16715 [Paenibacillus flagellatus]
MTIRRPVYALRGQSFFGRDFPVFVNRASETFDLVEHSHDFAEIAYVAEGKGFHYIGDRVIPVRKGDLFYIPVGMSHVFRPSDGSAKSPLIVHNCIIGLELFDRIVASHSLLLPEEETGALVSIRNRTEWLRAEEGTSDARHVMERLYAEYAAKREGRALMIVTYVVQLLLVLARSVRDADRGQFADADVRMERAIRLIASRLDDPPPVSEVAAAVNIGPRHFHRLFKRSTGQTYTDYVHSRQIEACCEQLRATDRKVYEIAESVGYKDPKYFHVLFKRKTGLSPREYRKRSRGVPETEGEEPAPD